MKDKCAQATETENQIETNTASAPSTITDQPSTVLAPAPDPATIQFDLLVAEKRAAGLPREDAEQIARKQLAHDATLTANRESDDAQTLTQLRKQIETLTTTADRLSAKLNRLEKLNTVSAPPTPSLN